MRQKTIIAGALLLMALPLQAKEQPPQILPKEFLAQLPLLMSLSDQEFENFLNKAQRKEKPKSAQNSGKEKRDDEN